MKTALGLRRLAYWLRPEPTEEWSSREQIRLTYKSLIQLRKARPALVSVLRSAGPLLQNVERPKLQLWRIVSGDCKQITKNNKKKSKIQAALMKTESWKKSQRDLRERNLEQMRSPWGHKKRIIKSKELIEKLNYESNQNECMKIIFWHHHDSRGLVPKIWINTFELLKKEKWTIIVSSTGMNAQSHRYLRKIGAIVAERANFGICLGAYRDFWCLLEEHIELRKRVNSIIFANDSTLPIKGAQKMVDCLSEVQTAIGKKEPILAGLTDSIERGKYHVQSYLLGVNKELMKMHEWAQFWARFDINGSKDELIDRGEIGLSQMALNNGVKIWVRHSLLENLLTAKTMKKELQRNGVKYMRDINQTLTCWESLLSRGFPMIKKQILLDPPVNPIPLTELHEHMSDFDPAMLEDIEELLRSKYLNT